MQAASAASKVVVVDASVLINFLIIERLDLLETRPGLRFVLPQEVDAEIRRPEQRRQLDKAPAFRSLSIEPSTEPAEIALAAALRLRQGVRLGNRPRHGPASRVVCRLR